MKKLLPLFVFSLLVILFSSNSYAQDTPDLQEIYEIAQTKVSEIAGKIDLNENDQAVLVRHITSREQSIARAKVNQQSSNSSLNLAEFVKQENKQFEKNIKSMFGDEKAKKILNHYELK